jgi:hypothetical protein
VLQHLVQLLQEESRPTLPNLNSLDGRSSKMSNRNITHIKEMSSHRQEKATGSLSDANEPQTQIRLSWEPSVHELACSGERAAQVSLMPTIQSSGITTLANRWDSPQ